MNGDAAIPSVIAAAGEAMETEYRAYFDDEYRSSSTRKLYRQRAAAFFRWAESRGLTLEAIDRPALAAYGDQIAAEGSRHEASVYLTPVRGVLRHLGAGIPAPGRRPAGAAKPRRSQGPSVAYDEVLRMSDAEVEDAFRRIRWPSTAGRPVCPRCAGADHYTLKADPLWKCKGCGYRFSPTSGTIFASRKLPLRSILAALAISGSRNALQMSRDLDIQYKTALDLASKIRSARAKSDGGQMIDSGIDLKAIRDDRRFGRSNRERRGGTATSVDAEIAQASIPLDILMHVVRLASAADGWIAGSEDFNAALVMLAPLSIGSRDPVALARFTGVLESSVRQYVSRLISNGIWLANGGLAVDWNDPEYGNVAFMMDSWVATGDFERGPPKQDTPGARVDFGYRLPKRGRKPET